jgi:hypothetical protein
MGTKIVFFESDEKSAAYLHFSDGKWAAICFFRLQDILHWISLWATTTLIVSITRRQRAMWLIT